MTAMSLPGLPLITPDSLNGYELVLTSPYMVAELEAPNPINDTNTTFLVLHRATKRCACEHFNYKAAKLCADGVRCVKSRNKVTTKQ